MSKDLTLIQKTAELVSPKSFEELMRFSDMVAKTQMVPTAYRGKPEDCFVGMQWGLQLGLQPMQALQNIAVINGRPSIYGDAMLALVRSSDVCEYVVEQCDGDKATCKAKRKGQPEQVATFTIEDAQKAKLWGKQGPWTQYPRRMLQMRARGFALRDVFPDVLQGLISAEEAQDYPEKEVQVDVVDTPVPAKKPDHKPALATQEQIATFWKCIEEDGLNVEARLVAEIKDGITADRLREIYKIVKAQVDQPPQEDVEDMMGGAE